MSRKDEVHVYALCWNEERMLPYFFRHYDGLADRYFIFDNGSTDRSLEMLRAHPRVVLGSFEVTGDSFVRAAAEHYNECWKQSRGRADWVVVCNIDEHVYHPDLPGYLRRCKAGGVTLVIPEGYNMVSDTFPQTEGRLCEAVRRGTRDGMWDKPEIFDPERIEEINFAPGRHWASPVGEVVAPRGERPKLLHFKYLGLDYVLGRHGELKTGLRALDIKKGWGVQYLWRERKTVKKFRSMKEKSVLVV
jgi:hypothetical protein